MIDQMRMMILIVVIRLTLNCLAFSPIWHAFASVIAKLVDVVVAADVVVNCW